MFNPIRSSYFNIYDPVTGNWCSADHFCSSSLPATAQRPLVTQHRSLIYLAIRWQCSNIPHSVSSPFHPIWVSKKFDLQVPVPKFLSTYSSFSMIKIPSETSFCSKEQLSSNGTLIVCLKGRQQFGRSNRHLTAGGSLFTCKPGKHEELTSV